MHVHVHVRYSSQRFTSTVHINIAPNVDALPADCLGVLGSLSCDDAADGMCYTASYAVQPDDSVTFTISARTPANTWVGLGVSDDQFMVSAAM